MSLKGLCDHLRERHGQVEVASVTPLKTLDSWGSDGVVELEQLPELLVVTLHVVSSSRPQVRHEDVACFAVSLSYLDNHRVLTLDAVVPLPHGLRLGVKLDACVGPGSERMLSDLNVSTCTLLAEAAGVSVEHVIEAVSLEHSWGFVLMGRDRSRVEVFAKGVGELGVELLDAQSVVVVPSVVNDICIGTVGVHEDVSVAGSAFRKTGSLIDYSEWTVWRW